MLIEKERKKRNAITGIHGYERKEKSKVKESPISSGDFKFLAGDLETLEVQEKGTECGGGVAG